MKRIYLVLIVLIGISVSCTKNYEDLNTDEKHPVEVPGDFIFANAQKALADQMASTNVNLNVWKLFAQYWTETTYTDESNYDIVNRSIPDNTYRTYYRDILSDFKNARAVIAAEAVVGEDATKAQQNRLHIITLLECFAYQELVDMFGNIPYSQALDIETINPVYDDAATIYNDLIAKVKEATNGLDAGFGSFGDNDLYNGGDVGMWKKFGNTLLIKLAINLSDVNPGLAQTTIADAFAAGVYDFGEVSQISYPGGANSNPLYVDLVQSGRDDFVPANTIVDIMNTLNDPRRDKYFTSFGGGYSGGIYGESNPYGAYSHIADAIQQATYPMVMMDYTELAFYLAEAAARGFFAEDAQTWYNNGIRASILSWGGTTADYDAYVAQASVAYNAANWKQSIGTQAWLAFYVRGFHGWTSWRRLDVPTLAMPTGAETVDKIAPRRFTYPVNEQTLNAANYDQAAAAIGPLGDVMHQKLFWDIN